MINIKMNNTETYFATLTPLKTWSKYNPCSLLKKLEIYPLSWLNLNFPVLNITTYALLKVPILHTHSIINMRTQYLPWILIRPLPQCASCAPLQIPPLLFLYIPSIIILKNQRFWLFLLEKYWKCSELASWSCSTQFSGSILIIISCLRNSYWIMGIMIFN